MSVILQTICVLSASAFGMIGYAQAEGGQRIVPNWLTACSANPIGSTECAGEYVGELMADTRAGTLQESVDVPNSAKVDFDLLENAIRQMGAAILSKQSKGGCSAVGGAEHAANAWKKNSGLPASSLAAHKELFTYLSGIMVNGSVYVRKGC